jgi:hypothetical protein
LPISHKHTPFKRTRLRKKGQGSNGEVVWRVSNALAKPDLKLTVQLNMGGREPVSASRLVENIDDATILFGVWKLPILTLSGVDATFVIGPPPPPAT